MTFEIQSASAKLQRHLSEYLALTRINGVRWNVAEHVRPLSSIFVDAKYVEHEKRLIALLNGLMSLVSSSFDLRLVQPVSDTQKRLLRDELQALKVKVLQTLRDVTDCAAYMRMLLAAD